MLLAIKDFDGYFISDQGEVFCNLGKGNRRNGRTTEFYKIKPRLTTNGYERIYARQTSTGRRKDLYIHRLVAEYFIPNPEHKRYVNHKNCKRNDNRAGNLEWCTAKENTTYSMEVGHVTRDAAGRYVSNFKYA